MLGSENKRKKINYTIILNYKIFRLTIYPYMTLSFSTKACSKNLSTVTVGNRKVTKTCSLYNLLRGSGEFDTTVPYFL